MTILMDPILEGKTSDLIFRRGKKSKKGLGIKTNWIMLEYILVESFDPPKYNISNEKVLTLANTFI